MGSKLGREIKVTEKRKGITGEYDDEGTVE